VLGTSQAKRRYQSLTSILLESLIICFGFSISLQLLNSTRWIFASTISNWSIQLSSSEDITKKFEKRKIRKSHKFGLTSQINVQYGDLDSLILRSDYLPITFCVACQLEKRDPKLGTSRKSFAVCTYQCRTWDNPVTWRSLGSMVVPGTCVGC
jgi:hypothetical protein